VELPPSTVACLGAHRLRQDEFRRQFGADYHTDLDLIFANPNGSPLNPNSILVNGIPAVPPPLHPGGTGCFRAEPP